MASQVFLDRVQALYVAYYGRPADQEGQAYWAERMDDEGEGAIINAFGTSAEYNDRFGEQSNANAVDNLYQQMFNRNAEPDGLAYWTGVLSSGEKSLAEIATTIMNAAGGIDRLALEAKVKAAAAYTEEFGAAEDYDLEAAIDVVDSAEAGVDPSALTELLGELQDAQDALTSFLESAADNEAVAAEITADEPTPAQIDTALDDALDTTAEEVESQLGLSGDAFVDAGANTQAGLIADGRAADQEAIDTAQEAVSDYKAEIAKVSGLSGAISAKSAADDRVEAATAAQTAANAELNGRLVTFAESNDGIDNSDIAYLDADDNATTTFSEVASITVGGVEIFTVEDGAVTSVAADGIKGVAALQAAVQAKLGAEAEYAAANTANDIADTRLANIEDLSDGDFDEENGTAVYEALVELEDALETAQEAQQELNDAVAAWEGVVALDAERTELEAAVEDAEDAITDAEDGLGVNMLVEDDGVSSDDGTVDFTGNDDVYLFNAENADDGTITVSSFGASGEDRIFFGDDYSFVELDAAWSQSADTGDASALEIFWAQSGTNLTLYVEGKAFAGNASSDADITEITLAGVTDFGFDGGYLTAGTAA